MPCVAMPRSISRAVAPLGSNATTSFGPRTRRGPSKRLPAARYAAWAAIGSLYSIVASGSTFPVTGWRCTARGEANTVSEACDHVSWQCKRVPRTRAGGRIARIFFCEAASRDAHRQSP